TGRATSAWAMRRAARSSSATPARPSCATCSPASTPPTSGRQSRGEAGRVARDPGPRLEVELGDGVALVGDEAVRTGMLDATFPAVDADRAAAGEHGPHLARLVGPAVGARLVG